MSIGFCKNFNFDKLIKNKSAEIQLDLFNGRLSNNIFEISFTWTRKCDHAGVNFTLAIFHLIYFHAMTYDHRHWDYDKDCWEEYDGK